MQRQKRIITAFCELSDIHDRDFETDHYARLLTNHSVQLLDFDDAGLLLAQKDGRLTEAGATTETVRRLQRLQLRLGDGPGIESAHTYDPVCGSDFRSESRWKPLQAAVLNAGFMAVHALPLQVSGQKIGSLSLFRRRVGPLGDRDQNLGEALVHVATRCLLLKKSIEKCEKLNAQLQTALNSRVVIEQAKGILAERSGNTLTSTFEAMRAFARRDRRQLRDIAKAIIDDCPSVSELMGPRPTEQRVVHRGH